MERKVRILTVSTLAMLGVFLDFFWSDVLFYGSKTTTKKNLSGCSGKKS